MTRKIIATDSEYPKRVPNGTVMTVTHDFHSGNVDAIVDGGDGINWFMTAGTFEEYTADDTPVLWRNMTPEQKGALLLAHHEGKVIEYNMFAKSCSGWSQIDDPMFSGSHAYRIKPSKPEPKKPREFWIDFDDGDISDTPVRQYTHVREVLDEL